MGDLALEFIGDVADATANSDGKPFCLQISWKAPHADSNNTEFTPDTAYASLYADGIPDHVEGDGDSDQDLIPDYLDPDSDDDGVPDSFEALLGTDPTESGAPGISLSPNLSAEPQTFRLSWKQRISHTFNQSYTLEKSVNLQGWDPLDDDDTVSVEPESPAFERVTVQIPLDEPRLFARLSTDVPVNSLFSDDFSGDLSQWENTSNAAIVDGAMEVSNNENIQSNQGDSWTDYSISVDITPLYETGGSIVFRKTDNNNQYMWHV